MNETISIMTVSIAALGGLAMVTTAGLSGWRGWLELQRAAIAGEQHRELATTPALAPAGARIELADLKERVRKLEAIAAGIDL
jgi:hypothetical protein